MKTENKVSVVSVEEETIISVSENQIDNMVDLAEKQQIDGAKLYFKSHIKILKQVSERENNPLLTLNDFISLTELFVREALNKEAE